MAGGTWTFQTLLTQEHVFLDAVADHGTILALYFSYAAQANVLRSTDGGATWNLTLTTGSGGTDGKVVYAGLIGGNKTWFVLGHNTAQSHISTDDGQTWSVVTDALTGGVAAGAGASDGNGTVIAGRNNGANLEASVNAGALAAFATPSGWALALEFSMLWDGTQFVAVEADSGPSNWGVWTAPSGFTIGAGPTWTQAGTGIANQWSVAGQAGLLAYVPGIGYAANIQAGGGFPQIVIASTPGGLASATPRQVTMDGGIAVQGFSGAGSYLFWGNGVGASGKAYRTADGTNWFQDTLSQALQGNERASYFIYDSAHSTYVLFGSQSTSTGSSIYTSPALIAVPNLTSGTFTTAAGETALTSIGLAVGPLTYASSHTVPAGNVINTAVLAGTLEPAGTAIGLIISSGFPIPTPGHGPAPSPTQPKRKVVRQSLALVVPQFPDEQTARLAQVVQALLDEAKRVQELLAGGAQGQMLTKNSTADYDGTWGPASSGPAGQKGDKGDQGIQGVQGTPGTPGVGTAGPAGPPGPVSPTWGRVFATMGGVSG